MTKTSNLKHFVLFLLVLIASLGTVSPVYAQQKPIEKRVTLNVKDVTAQSFFNTMHRLTGLDFIYSTDLVKSLPHVTVKANNQPASTVLSNVLSGLNCRYDVMVTSSPSRGAWPRHARAPSPASSTTRAAIRCPA